MGVDPEGEANETQPESDEGGELSQKALDAIVRGTSDRWVKGYGNLGSAAAVVGAAVMSASAMEMVTSMIARMMVLYAQKGPGM